MVEKTIIEVIQPIWWVAAVAFGASLLLTPVVRFIAYRARIVDRPDDLLKPHARPTAYLGGVAMCIGLLVGLVGYVAAMDDLAVQWADLVDGLTTCGLRSVMANPLWQLGSIALAAVLITVVGLLDDVLDISPKQKVFGQVIAAAILVVGGVGHRMALVLFSGTGFTPPMWLLVPLSSAMCLVTVVATCNATNLLDGLDGLCGGVTGIIALGFLALAVWLAMWARFPGTDEVRVVLCLAMAGAVLGFLPYNIPPASIFMGDAGSMLLGFFVATMMALFCREGSVRWFLAAVAVFILPVLDTGLAVVRRILAGKSIFAGDRSHLYDQLVDRGMSVTQVVVLFYILATGAAALGVLVAVYLRVRWALPLYLVLFALAWVVFHFLGMIRPQSRQTHGEEQTD